MAHLVFQTAFPGDLLLSIPLIKKIREWDPDSDLVLACRPGLGDFFVEQGLVDRIISVDKKNQNKVALKELKSMTWDTLFVPHQSVRTALWMRQLRAKNKISFFKWWNSFIYSKRVRRPNALPDALRQLSLLAAIDDKFAELFASEEVLLLSNSTQQETIDFCLPQIPQWASMQVLKNQPQQNLIFLAPGSVWNTKRWNGYLELAQRLVNKGFQVELVGNSAEKTICDEIAKKIKVSNMAGQTNFNQLINRLSQGLMLVSNDSGAMHAAAVANLPTVAIFGPTTLDIGYRPWQNRAVVVQKNIKCRPCGRHGHDQCPIGTHECMKSISVDDVLNSIDLLRAKL